MDNDTLPAGDSAATATPLSDALDTSDRHQAQERHEAPREVGAARETPASADTIAPPAAAAAAQPGAQAPPAAVSADPAGDAGDPNTPPANAPPKWYRDHMARTNRELAAERAELARLRGQGGGQHQGAQPGPQSQQGYTLPDPVDDPEGYHRAVTSQFASRQERFEFEATLRFSERFARREHGSEAFEECKAWLSTKPDLADWCAAQSDPWETAIQEYRKERLLDEIGTDPEAYKKRLRDEWEAEAAARQGQPPAGQTMTRREARPTPPPPASGARSAGSGQDRDGQGRFVPTELGAVLGRRA